MIRARFTVTGHTVREVEQQADEALRGLSEDPDASGWRSSVDLKPLVEVAAGEIVLWEGEVDATYFGLERPPAVAADTDQAVAQVQQQWQVSS